MKRIKKLLGAVLGGATGAGVAGVLALVGVDVPTVVDMALATVLAWAGTWLAPANAPKADT